MQYHLRIARPVSDLMLAQTMYCAGLSLTVIGSFENHEGFDGIMLGRDGLNYHFEFTHCRRHPVVPSPTSEDLAVFYIPDALEWKGACARMRAAEFQRVASFNPYWDVQGCTFEDSDGYHVVLQRASWKGTSVKKDPTAPPVLES